MRITTLFLVAILCFIIVVAILLIQMNRRSIIVDGFNPAFAWDYEQMEKINAEQGFTIDDNATNTQFRDYLLNTKKWTYSLYEIPGDPNEDFPKWGEGVCMTDWYSVTDTTNNITNARTVRDKATGKDNYSSVYNLDPESSYKVCKQRALDAKATVFAIQYGGQCFVGNTNELALGIDAVANKDTRTNNIPMDAKNCNRPGYANGNGSGWTQTVYARGLPTQVYRFDNYTENIKELVTKDITSFSKLRSINDLNSRLGFTPMRSASATIEGATDMVGGIPVSGQPIDQARGVNITSANGKQPAVNNKIISLLQKYRYAVTVEEYDEFVNAMQGGNMEAYIIILKRYLKISSEDVMKQMIEKLKTLHPHEQTFSTPLVMAIILICYGIQDVNAIIDPFNKGTNWFTLAITENGLDKLSIPMFPPTNFGGNNQDPNYFSENVLMKLWSIGVMAPHISEFFGVFKAESATASDFFDKIMPVLTSDSFRYWYTGVDKIKQIIQYVLPTSQGKGLAAGFVNFNTVLASLNLSFDGYVIFIDKLTKTVGPLTDAQGLIVKFTQYYTTVAYSDKIDFVAKTPVTADMIFTEFIDIIDPVQGNDKRYFSPTGNIVEYLQILIDRKYNIASIKRDKALGQTYASFMGGGNIADLISGGVQIGFHTLENMNDSFSIQKSISQIFNTMLNVGKRALGFKEGNAPMADSSVSADSAITNVASELAANANTELALNGTIASPDHKALVNFGITDFSAQLGELERTLMSQNYGISDWTSLMNFVKPLSKLIQYSQLNNFIKTMTDFGAKTQKEWMALADDLSKIKIISYADLSAFLNIIIPFGVNYENFDEFKDTLQAFNANFAESLPSINPSALSIFCKDMTESGYRFNNPENKQIINNIIGYFTSAKYNLQTYPQFPSALIKAIRAYDNSDPYKTKMYDIVQNPPLTQKLPVEINSAPIVVQAYLIASNQSTYKSSNSILVGNSTNLIHFVAFLYKEEYELMKSDNGPTAYFTVESRLKLMNDMSVAVTAAAKTVTIERKENLIELYTTLSHLLTVFPLLMFRFLYNTVRNNCMNGNMCITNLDNSVDPTYTSAKATTTNLTTNYRKNPPIL
jgi:hypothetical protein